MNRGELWQVAFDPAVGEEIQKTRPAIIVSSDAVGNLRLRVVVPVTTWQPRFARASWMVRLEPSRSNGLVVASAADAFQVKSISTQRFRSRIGILSAQELETIVEAVGVVIQHP